MPEQSYNGFTADDVRRMADAGLTHEQIAEVLEGRAEAPPEPSWGSQATKAAFKALAGDVEAPLTYSELQGGVFGRDPEEQFRMLDEERMRTSPDRLLSGDPEAWGQLGGAALGYGGAWVGGPLLGGLARLGRWGASKVAMPKGAQALRDAVKATNPPTPQISATPPPPPPTYAGGVAPDRQLALLRDVNPYQAAPGQPTPLPQFLRAPHYTTPPPLPRAGAPATAPPPGAGAPINPNLGPSMPNPLEAALRHYGRR